jgi:hypothetical protein
VRELAVSSHHVPPIFEFGTVGASARLPLTREARLCIRVYVVGLGGPVGDTSLSIVRLRPCFVGAVHRGMCMSSPTAVTTSSSGWTRETMSSRKINESAAMRRCTFETRYPRPASSNASQDRFCQEASSLTRAPPRGTHNPESHASYSLHPSPAPPPLQFQGAGTEPTHAPSSRWLWRSWTVGGLGAGLSFPFVARRTKPATPAPAGNCPHRLFSEPSYLVTALPIKASHFKPLTLILRHLCRIHDFELAANTPSLASFAAI